MREANRQADAFEKQAIQHHVDTTGHKTWPWFFVSEQTLTDAGYITNFMYQRLNRLQRYEEGKNPFTDYGADGIAAETKEDGAVVYHILQMKHYPCGRRITAKDLGSTFVMKDNMRLANSASRSYLYYHGRLEKRIEGYFLGNSEWVVEHLPSCVPETVKYNSTDAQNLPEHVECLTVCKPQVPTSPSTPSVPKFWLHQEECLTVLSSEWKGRVSIVLPPGTGKTNIMNQFAREHYKKVIYVSPLIAHAEQNLERFRSFADPDTVFIPVHSNGGTRDIDLIKKKISLPSWLLSTTYDSAKNIILPLFSNGIYDDVLLIIDEVHNAEHPQIYELGNHFRQVLSATATPLENSKYWPIFTYYLIDAINEGIICDYQIFLPEIMFDGQTKTMAELDDDTLILQSKFLLDGLLMTGSRRTIAMASDIIQCEVFRKALINVSVNYHGFEPVIHIMTSETSAPERRRILDDFSMEGENDVIKIILHVKILVEAIDVPRCDSVYLNRANFANNTKPVQAAFRANRRLVSHPNKIANVFVWADENADLIDTFSLLREGDPSFIKKIKLIGRDYDCQADREVRKRLAEKLDAMHEFFTVRCVNVKETWDERFNKLRDFFVTNGRWPSRNNNDAYEYRLAIWLSDQRTAYVNAKLSPGRKDALASIDATWVGKAGQGRDKSSFEKRLEDLRDHFNATHQWPSETDPEERVQKLAKFLGRCRTAYRKGGLSQNHIDTFNSIEPSWTGRVTETPTARSFDESIEELKAFYLREKRWPSQKTENKETNRLGNFLSKNRTLYKNGELEQERLDAFNSVHPTWIGKAGQGEPPTPFEENLEKLREYFQDNARWPPEKTDDKEIRKIATFLKGKREDYSDGKLSQERMVALNSIHPTWVGRTKPKVANP